MIKYGIALGAKGIQGGLLQLLGNYLEDRCLSVVVNGQTSESLPVEASVPQSLILGPLLWNVYVNDLLQLLPAVTACTASPIFIPARNVNELLRPSTSSYE